MMLNLNGTNEFIQLNCRTWWPETKVARPTIMRVNAEEPIPYNQNNRERQLTLPPTSVYFTIEFA